MDGIAPFPTAGAEVGSEASATVGDQEVGLCVPVEISQGGRELFPSFPKGKGHLLFLAEKGCRRGALVEKQVDVVGRVGALADQEVGLPVTIPVVQERSEDVAPAAGGVFPRRNHRFGQRLWLRELRRLGCPAVADDEKVAEIITGHEVQFARPGEVGEGHPHAKAPFGPLLVPTADFVAPAEPGRTPRRIAFARGEPWGGNFSGGEFGLLLAPAVEIDAQVPQRIGGEEVGQSVAVEIADGHGHRHGGFGHIPALIQDGKKTAKTG